MLYEVIVRRRDVFVRQNGQVVWHGDNIYRGGCRPINGYSYALGFIKETSGQQVASVEDSGCGRFVVTTGVPAHHALEELVMSPVDASDSPTLTWP